MIVLKEVFATYYENGRKLYDDMEDAQAAAMLTLAFEGGVEDAAELLARLYGNPDSPCLDEQKFEHWRSVHLFGLRHRSASDPSCKLRLGIHYQFGDLVPPSPEKALALISSAAHDGLRDAQFHLGVLYKYGLCGTTPSIDESLVWIRLAAEARHPEAMFSLGVHLRSAGSSEGLSLITEAAAAGFWPAKEFLASIDAEFGA